MQEQKITKQVIPKCAKILDSTENTPIQVFPL